LATGLPECRCIFVRHSCTTRKSAVSKSRGSRSKSESDHQGSGGELLDQGVHLIDLARWFLGDFRDVTGSIHTYFWNIEVEDNGFLLLRTAQNQVAQLHVSWTEWKNLFSLEICAKHAKLEINGLGGSYGIERLTLHQMLPRLGPPETTMAGISRLKLGTSPIGRPKLTKAAGLKTWIFFKWGARPGSFSRYSCPEPR